MIPVTPDLVLAAYAHGYFPMADHRRDETLGWYKPTMRGVIPLDRFHLPRSLKKVVRQRRFEVRFDTAFRETVVACADRAETWINDTIIDLYTELHRRGNAHSVESWRDGRLVGGLYGVQINGAFFGESMFSREPNASRVALVHLVERLRERGFLLLDTQYGNEHLSQFGCVEIDDADFMRQLERALATPCTFEE